MSHTISWHANAALESSCNSTKNVLILAWTASRILIFGESARLYIWPKGQNACFAGENLVYQHGISGLVQLFFVALLLLLCIINIASWHLVLFQLGVIVERCRVQHIIVVRAKIVLIYICERTHPYVHHEWFTCGHSRRATTHSNAWLDSSTCATCLIHVCDVTHPCMWDASWLIHVWTWQRLQDDMRRDELQALHLWLTSILHWVESVAPLAMSLLLPIFHHFLFFYFWHHSWTLLWILGESYCESWVDYGPDKEKLNKQ